jgi:catechol 2,3-dioxygenase-like lactoylglutathione lyase family enzyme
MVKGIAHVCFVVSDLERSIRFYRDALGMTPAFDFRNESGRRTGLYLHAGSRTFIELFEGQSSQPKDPASFRHVCLEVEDVETAVKRIRQAGIEASDAKLGRDHSFQAWLADPDGNHIEIHGYTPESEQEKYLRGKLGGP